MIGDVIKNKYKNIREISDDYNISRCVLQNIFHERIWKEATKNKKEDLKIVREKLRMMI